MLLKKHMLTNYLLLILSIFFTFLAAELFCRLVQPSQKNGNHHNLFCEYDSNLGWKHKPNSNNLHIESEYRVKEFFNSKGIRGPEYFYEKPKDEFRILILGDSFAEGYTVNFENLFSEVIKQELKNRKINCAVINAGTGGYSTDQEYLFFKNEGKKYRPDLTVLMFCQNDVWYNTQPKYWRGYKPYFQIMDGKLVLMNVPCPKPDTNILKIKQKPNSIKKWLLDNSLVCNIINNFIRTNRWALKIALRVNLVEVKKVPSEFYVFKKNYKFTYDNAWRITEAIIFELKKETFFINSRLLVFYIPADAGIYKRSWEILKENYGLDDKEWDIGQAGIVLKDICKKRSIDFIDPTEKFRAEAKNLQDIGSRLYFSKDKHWTIQGHRLAGKLLGDFIYEHYLRK